MITLSTIFYFYIFIVLLFIIFSLVNFYHLLRFGFLGMTNIVVIGIYIMVSLIILAFSFYKLNSVDWSMPLISFGNIFEVNTDIFR